MFRWLLPVLVSGCLATGGPVRPTSVQGTEAARACPPGRKLLFHLNLADSRWNCGAPGVQAAVAAMGSTVMAGAANASVVEDPEYGRALAVVYPAESGSITCVARKRCAVHGGLVFRVPLPGGHTISSAWLSYRVKFEPGFEWVKGGKLPGLCGGGCATGGRRVEPDRFSIRYMWRAGGEATVYTYLGNPPGSGRGLPVGSWRWQADGRWHQVQQELILNTGNHDDGVIRVWYDRALADPPSFERTDLRYYDRVRFPELGIDKLIFSTFHGGQDASWSPSRDVRAYFTDLTVCR